MPEPRHLLLKLYRHALARVHGERVVRDGVADLSGDFHIVVLGKSTAAMSAGLRAVDGLHVRSGFACIPRGYEPLAPSPGWDIHYGGHPIPDASSLDAGRALIDWLRSLPNGDSLLVLMSGGSSACVEHLLDGMSLEEVARRTRELFASGADIRALNAARSEWSLLKKGRALEYAGGRSVYLRVLSDVPGDDPALVGSGPFYSSRLGAQVRVVAGNSTAVAAVVELAEAHDLTVQECGEITGDAARQGFRIGRQLRDAEPGVYVWGGESTVVLPTNPGRGGRCQHLALAAAGELVGNERVTLLAAGTDGVDGASPDAGALVDGGSAARMRDEGFDGADALRRADSNRALAASGDLVNTGPTGTNVMDLVIALVE